MARPMKAESTEKGKMTVAGFDVGGAHLKVARAEQGRIDEDHARLFAGLGETGVLT